MLSVEALKLAIVALFLVLGAAASVIDIRQRIIPDRLVFPGFAVLVLVAFAFSLSLSLSPVLAGLAGSAVLFAIFLLLALVSRGALGGGDVKFALPCGFVAGVIGGFAGVGFALAGIFVLGGVVALFFLLARRGTDIPFAPIMTIGSLAAFIAG